MSTPHSSTTPSSTTPSGRKQTGTTHTAATSWRPNRAADIWPPLIGAAVIVALMVWTGGSNYRQDLVQLAREDRVEPSPEPIDLRDVVTNAIERARRRGPGPDRGAHPRPARGRAP